MQLKGFCIAHMIIEVLSMKMVKYVFVSYTLKEYMYNGTKPEQHIISVWSNNVVII